MSIDKPSAANADPALEIWLATGLEAAFDPAILTADEAERHRQLRSPHKRAQFELSRTLLHQLTPARKATSLAHSENLVVVAIGDPPMVIGVDIEKHKSRDVISLAHFAFDPREAEALTRHPNAFELFYDLWVLKEACAKALSLSLVDALRGCVFTVEDRIVRGALPTTATWSAYVWRPRADVSLGVVLTQFERPCKVKLHEWPSGKRASWPAIATVAGDDATAP